MDRHFLQACILFDQGRYDLAEEKLRLSLAEEPDHSLAHALLADCLRQSDKLKEATAEAREAVRLDPELAQAHAALARVLSDRNYHADADAAAREAIRIDPDDADYRALLAAMLIERRDWQAALDAAEAGLELDAEHTGCSNLRSMALVKLGRNQEAREIGESALARDPHDAFSHASQGWALLNAGDRGKALEHFREALRLEPGMEYARLGIVEALKAQHLIYALMLRYFLWMGRLGRTVQWAIILGGYFGYRILYDLKEKNPALSPWINPLLVAYFIFAIMTWLASPLFNLMLRLNKFGRHILSREQTLESN